MNTKLALLATPMLILAASVATAENRWDGITPYAGADAEWRHLDFKRGFGDNTFRHDYPQGNLYVGLKLNCYFGVEAGYEATERKTRTTTFFPGTVVNGLPIGAPTISQQIASTGQITGHHASLLGFYPLCDAYKLTLLGSVGFARLQGKFLSATISRNGVPVMEFSNFIQRKGVLRVGGGLQHMIATDWGVRAMLKWENTNRFKNIGAEAIAAGVPRLKLKNSLIYSLGVFYKFC